MLGDHVWTVSQFLGLLMKVLKLLFDYHIRRSNFV